MQSAARYVWVMFDISISLMCWHCIIMQNSCIVPSLFCFLGLNVTSRACKKKQMGLGDVSCLLVIYCCVLFSFCSVVERNEQAYLSRLCNLFCLWTQINSLGVVHGVLENKLAPGLSFIISGELDHTSGKSQFGLGFVIGQ